MGNKLAKEIARHVLDGIEAETSNRESAQDPSAPVENVLLDVWVSVVNVAKHEVVKVAVLLVYVFGPVLAIALNSEDVLLLCLVVPVYSGKVFKAPLEE